ncbi:hypothetical protein BJ875DRAFT_484396 [Amylocarpus encephaloides]|uniref:Nucleoporin NUP37 n=1 Tax=Amylocarpus encephaloides TaxID=45428 RepID=A0A9P7YJC2_9HELO|nr:hypothetical protein BJ875DRAFT_484396 [Amylocarpus encephaloides]
MSSKLSKPRIVKNQKNTQLSYELPHRIYAAKCYPVASSNGSTVIIYATDTGVKIIWRGGKQFKTPTAPSTASQKANGAADTVMILDSDDEGPPAKFEDKPEFELDEEAFDPSHPFPGILQTLDLHLGTTVLQIAVLPSSVLEAEGDSWKHLETLKKEMVFAAACADNSVKLVTLPLTPPSPESKSRSEFRESFVDAHAGRGKWGETVTTLSGHQKPSEGVSLTVETNTPAKDRPKSEPQFIVASYSSEINGLLNLYRISLKSPQVDLPPFQKVFLSTPARRISFNPSLSPHRSPHLLIADTKGACRIYDYKTLSTTSEEGTERLVAENGTWLLSLYTHFQNPKNSQSRIGAYNGFGRKPIIDAQWASGGKAIIVLLSDGEWGIWDIEGAGPGASKGLLGPQGVKGGSVSQYSLTGYIDIASKPRQPGPPQITGSKFAPMTPSTRKTVGFLGNNPLSGPVQGQISIVEVQSSNPTNPSEESVIFWLGETFTQISNLSKYWSTNSRTGASKSSSNLFNGSASSRAVRIEVANLQGERCLAIEQIPKSHSTTADLPTNLLVLGEHRFTIIETGKQTKLSKPRVTTEPPTVVSQNGNGNLDVIGINQALSRMEKGQTKRGKLFQP